MAQITLTIPDNQVQRVVDALVYAQSDPATGEPLAATPANAKAVVIGWIRDQVKTYEHEQARRAAFAALTPPDTSGLVS